LSQHGIVVNPQVVASIVSTHEIIATSCKFYPNKENGTNISNDNDNNDSDHKNNNNDNKLRTIFSLQLADLHNSLCPCQPQVTYKPL
jgi:deoxycytidylate deaminase